jgi:hypothetical protein
VRGARIARSSRLAARLAQLALLMHFGFLCDFADELDKTNMLKIRLS